MDRRTSRARTLRAGLSAFLLALASLAAAPVLWAQGLPSAMLAAAATSTPRAPSLYERLASPRAGAQANGRFRVDVFSHGKWQPAGAVGADKYVRELELALPPAGLAGPVRLRIRPEGGGAAHLDAVTLDGRPPLGAAGAPLSKLQRAELDVAHVPPQGVEVTFAPTAGAATLRLHGRIEAEAISKVPAQFPRANTHREITPDSAFYGYEIGSSPGRLQVDGDLSGEKLGASFFREFVPSGSGHPQAPTYGWVRDDGETLYVAIDLVPDNTMDGGKDYAKVYVNTPAGARMFKVSQSEQRWGRPGFTYTPRAEWQHKVYEFAIPFSELGIAPERPAESLQVAFGVYGTFSPNVSHQIAYNGIRNEYAFIYVDASSQAWVQRVDAAGVVAGTPQPVSGAGVAAIFDQSASIAWNSRDDEYMVLWSVSGTGSNIEGIRVDAGVTGTVGEMFTVATTAANQTLDQQTQALAYDNINNRYLVVWLEELGDQEGDIWGRLIAADGSPVTAGDAGVIKISVASNDEIYPDVAFDPTGGRFLVVWEASGGSPGIYGLLVNADGSFYDRNGNGTAGAADDRITIGDPALIQRFPSVAFDTGNNQYFVSWVDEVTVDNTNFDIYGRIVGATGSLPAAKFAVSEDDTSSDNHPEVAFAASTASGFRVLWHDGSDVVSNAVSTAGAAGTETDTGNDSLFGEEGDIAANSYCGNFVAVHSVFDNSAANTLSLIGACATSPALSWSGGTVSPAGAVAGSTFQFRVTYTHSSGTAPTTAQLLLDVNRDGSFATATVAPPAVGAGPGVAAWGALPVAALALMLWLGLGPALASRRRRAWAPALPAALCLTGLVLLVACTSDSGSNGSSPAEPTGPQEVYTLTVTGADTAGDGNHANGEEYGVDVLISAAGSYRYRFNLSEGSNTAGGDPSLVRILVVSP